MHRVGRVEGGGASPAEGGDCASEQSSRRPRRWAESVRRFRGQPGLRSPRTPGLPGARALAGLASLGWSGFSCYTCKDLTAPPRLSTRPSPGPCQPESAGHSEVRPRPDGYVAFAAGPYRPNPPLQHRLRLLQRVRQGVEPAVCSQSVHRADRPPRPAPHLRRRLPRRRRGDAPPGPGQAHRPHPRPRHDGGADHERLLLSPKRILALNAAGLDFLPISIDNIEPTVLQEEPAAARQEAAVAAGIRHLRGININSVLGGGMVNPEDARTINRRARELGLSRASIDHHPRRQRQPGEPLGPTERAVFDGVTRRDRRHLADGQEPLLRDPQLPGEPRRRQAQHLALHHAGARYLYICEEGLVHYCSQQRGYPSVPLIPSTQIDDIRREVFLAPKSCAPFCTIGCVHRVSTMDCWRKPQDAGDRSPRGSSAALEPRS